MNWENLFDKGFKVGIGLFILAIIMFVLALFLGDAGAILALLAMLVGGLSSLALLVSWVAATVQIFNSKKVETVWKVVWILVMLVGLGFFALLYHYFKGRKQI